METKMYESITRPVPEPINSSYISEVYPHKEYKIVEGQSIHILELNVIHWINEGYELYGSPFVLNNYIHQAMTRGI